MSALWSIFVIVLTVLSIVGCLWLLIWQSRGHTGPQTTHVWDDDLTEYNNPLPRWWLNLFVITIVFSVVYLLLFPGLGGIAGQLGWTSKAEMQARLDQLTEQRQARFAKLADKPLPALVHDEVALSLGRSVYVANCAGCHGVDATGAIGFPNLRDQDWLYGGEPQTVLASIVNGRNGQMPGLEAALSEDQIQALVDFLPHWSDTKLDDAVREAGMAAYAGICAACHGPDGKGNTALGAPNLTDEIWLWGARPEQLRQTIVAGRNNSMPPHRDLLSPQEARVVAAYVLSLSATDAMAHQPALDTEEIVAKR